MTNCCRHFPPSFYNDKCHSEEINLETELKNMGFSKTQIDWVTEHLIQLLGRQDLKVESVGQFPINHDYGFDCYGWVTPFSEWNVCITFKELNYLLIKPII